MGFENFEGSGGRMKRIAEEVNTTTRERAESWAGVKAEVLNLFPGVDADAIDVLHKEALEMNEQFDKDHPSMEERREGLKNELINDPTLAIYLLQGPMGVYFTPKSRSENPFVFEKDFWMEVLAENPAAWEEIVYTSELKDIALDPEVLDLVLSRDGMRLKHLSLQISDIDIELVRVAVEQNPKALRYVPDYVKEKLGATETAE